MSAQEALSKYQLGKYLFTKERIPEGGLFSGDDPQTSYKMYREPSEGEWAEEPDYAQASDVGTLTVAHHPRQEIPPQVTRHVVRNAAAKAEARQPGVLDSKLAGAEGCGRIVASKGWHERYSPTDIVHLMTVAKESRTMVPTMLALGQRAAKETTGRDLQPSEDLSVHSQRLVDRFKEAGVVPESHSSVRNRIDFLPPIPTGVPGGLEGYLSRIQQHKQRYGQMVDMEEPIPLPDVERAKAEGREIVRRARPWTKGS